MTTINVSLPDPLGKYVEAQVQKGGYSSASEYIRALVRKDQVRTASAELRQKLRDGLDSGELIPVSPEFWNGLRARIKDAMGQAGAS